MCAAPSSVARRWQFTNFKFDNIELETFCEAGLESETALRYICFGDETCPDTGRRHMQGYAELHRPMRGSSVQKLLARLGCDPKCHIEVARAHREANLSYCRKEGTFHEAGSWKAGGQGARCDLLPAIEFAKTAPTAWDLIEQFPIEFCKYSRGLDRIRVLAAKRAARHYRPIEVHVLWGDPGTRKTDRTGLNRDHDVFSVACGDTFPFDNYDGEGTIVFDDFYGQLRCADMLSWCNGQYGAVTIKHGAAYRAWTKVYITSNTAPDTWYPNVPQNVRRAFLSRLTTVTHVVGACERPPTKYFVLNTLSNECNEVDCNTRAPSSTAQCAPSPVLESPLPFDADSIAVLRELFGDTDALDKLEGVMTRDETPEPAAIAPAPPAEAPAEPPAAAPATTKPGATKRLKGKARKRAASGPRTARDTRGTVEPAQPALSPEDEFRAAYTTTLGRPPKS